MRSYSQPATQQDVWVINRLEGKRNGFFVEIGAHDGIHHSNTKMLEDHYGWSGVLVEPNPQLYEDLARNRSNCKLRDEVIGPEHDQMLFFLYGNSYGGLRLYMPDDWKAEHDRRRTWGEYRRTRTLRWLLDQTRAPTVIDYLSLDVEGAELAILESFWREGHSSTYQFNIITVEFRYDALLLAKLEELLAPQYTLEHTEAFDAFFVNKRLASCTRLAA